MTSPRRAAKGPILTGLALCLLLICGFGGWAALARLSGAVVAPGQIAVEDSRIAIQPTEGGIVATLAVREAEAVSAGQLLLRLDDGALTTELLVVDSRLTGIAAQIARFTAESTGIPRPEFPPSLLDAAATDPDIADQIDLQRRLFDTRQQAMAQLSDQQHRRIAQLRAQADGLTQQRTALQEQLTLLEKEAAAQSHLLDRGLTQQARLLGLQGEAAGIRGEIGAATAQIAAAGEQEAATRTELLRFGIARREEAEAALQDLTQEARELTGRRVELRARLARLDLRAPVAGVVIGLQAGHAGAVLREAEPALYLVPSERRLVATAQVAPAEATRVHPGQPARLTLVGAGAGRPVELTGQLVSVSADVLHDATTGAGFYRVEILLDPPPADAPRLTAGMPVEVFVATGARSPLAYMLEPFTSYFTHAFRES